MIKRFDDSVLVQIGLRLFSMHRKDRTDRSKVINRASDSWLLRLPDLIGAYRTGVLGFSKARLHPVG